jgi:hypothetical protein
MWNILLMILGIPFFAVIAMLESHKNPLLTRASTDQQIQDRVSACYTCVVLCLFVGVGLVIYLTVSSKQQLSVNKRREENELARIRDGIQHQEAD